MSPKHKTLQRQLEKLGLSEDKMPTELPVWTGLLERVSAKYSEAEEDRYLLERSLEISSEEMKERFAQINMLVKQLELNRDVLKELLNDKSIEEVLCRFAGDIERRMSGFYCGIFHSVDDSSQMALIGFSQLPEKIQKAFSVVPLNNRCPCGAAAIERQQVSYVDDKNHPMHEELLSLGIGSMHAFPVGVGNGNAISILTLWSPRVVSLTPEQVTFLKSLSEMIQLVHKYIDIKKSLQKEQLTLIARDKMATLGEMAGGVAHEINNPLFIIQGYVDIISAAIEDGKLNEAEIMDACNGMTDNIERVAKIVGTLGSFSRDASSDPLEPTRVAGIIKGATELSSRRYEDIKFEVSCDPTLGETVIMCRSIEIVQVLVNLLNNSFYAVRGSKDAWMKLEVISVAENIEFRVTDCGNGIPEKVVSKIFQPFFTTKPVGAGTGLGLSISKKIIESHSGVLRYSSDSPNTQFIISLPKAKAA